MPNASRFSIAVLFALASLMPLHARAGQTATPIEDEAAIKQAALDYIDGWYTADAGRMERALHPRLAKRVVVVNPRDGRSVLLDTSALELVQQTRAGGGRETAAEDRRDEVRILDRFDDMATVRIDATDWVDYLQLARFNGQWVIVNVLWAPRPKT